MSDEKQETMDDIVREMRNLGKLDEKSTDKIPRSLMGLGLRTYADRIEAAWKREKAEVEASALAAGGIVEASRHKQVGNSVAMRSVLVNIATEMIGLIETQNNGRARFQPQAVLDEIKQVIPELEGV